VFFLNTVYITVRPFFRLSRGRMGQSKTAEVRIMKFLLYGSPMCVFCEVSFILKF